MMNFLFKKYIQGGGNKMSWHNGVYPGVGKEYRDKYNDIHRIGGPAFISTFPKDKKEYWLNGYQYFIEEDYWKAVRSKRYKK